MTRKRTKSANAPRPSSKARAAQQQTHHHAREEQEEQEQQHPRSANDERARGVNGWTNRAALADRLAGGAIALAAFGLYAATACRTVYTEDSAEFATAAGVWGVPHPPGYPLYTLLAGAFVRVIPVGNMAARVNLFSAAAAAGAVAVVWFLLRRMGRSRAASIATCACLAFGDTAWSQAVVAEVHAFNALLMTLALWTTIHARAQRSPRAFATWGLATGLWVGHRNLNLIFVPALLIMLFAGKRKRANSAVQDATPGATTEPPPPRRRLVLLVAVGAAAATALVYLYLPLAARRHPPLEVGAPTTWARFYAVVSAQPYFRHFASGDMSTVWARFVEFLSRLPRDIGWAAVAVPWGFVRLRRADAWQGQARFAAFAWIAGVCALFASLYNVLDVQTYFLPVHLALAVVAAFAWPAADDAGGPPSRPNGVVESSRQQPRHTHGVAARATTVGLHLVVVAMLIAQLVGGWRHNDLRAMRAAEAYVRDLLRGAPPMALLVSFGDTSDHLLTYAQAIDGVRSDVVVVAGNQLTDWYIEALRRQHPQVKWPGEDPSSGLEWFRALANMNAGERPICLTHAVRLGTSDGDFSPHGLLTCMKAGSPSPRDAQQANREAPQQSPPHQPSTPMSPGDMAREVAFWKDARPPTPPELELGDVHVRMVAFSYATARFAFARALADANAIPEARAQLGGLLRMAPDKQEQAIAAALATIGRGVRRPFAYGARAERALAVSPDDPVEFRTALNDDVSDSSARP